MTATQELMQQEAAVFGGLQLEQQTTGSAARKKDAASLTAPSMSGSVQLVISSSEEGSSSSIYDQYSNARRWFILAIVSFTAIIVPLTDTIYLPGIEALKKDFNTNQQLASASVAVYLAAVGVSALFWGPAADRYGRKPTYLVTVVTFIATTLGCLFSPSIEVFIACRMLQGLAVPPFTTNSTAVVADIFPPRQRGTAMGLRSLPLLIGPVAGPLLGGFLCQAFGWRSTFILLAVMAAAVLPLLVIFVPETHQYVVLQRLERADPAAAKAVEEAESIRAQPPVFQAPWAPLANICRPSALPHALISMISFGVWFAVLGELSTMLAQPPYGFSQALIGISFLPMGVAGMIASPVGGWLADKSAAAAPGFRFARLEWGNMMTLIVCPAGLLLFGWSVTYHLHIAGPFMGTVLTAAGAFAYTPCYFSWLSNGNQQQAAAVTGAAQAMLFLAAGVVYQCSSIGVAAMGAGGFMSLLAGVQMVLSAIAVVQFVYTKKRDAAAAASAAQASGDASC